MKYKLCSGSNRFDLANEVDLHVRDNWELHGSPSVASLPNGGLLLLPSSYLEGS